jgi:hypothetical protein
MNQNRSNMATDRGYVGPEPRYEPELFELEPHLSTYGEYRPTFFVQKRMLLALALAIGMGMLLFVIKPDSNLVANSVEAAVLSEPMQPDIVEDTEMPTGSLLAPFFTPEVKHWEPMIQKWSATFDLDPNLVAIIMQVESCGDPSAVSVAGAQGLFQVMPFHFDPGENGFDPETNAFRGLNYFRDRLVQTEGDIGLAFAGYNGGHVAAGSGWDFWANETRSYYVWTTGIYQDIASGEMESNTLQRWLQAGGASLCRQASDRLGL